MLITPAQANGSASSLVRPSKSSAPPNGASTVMDTIGTSVEPSPQGMGRKAINAVGGGVTAITTGAAMLDAFPGFIYPSVFNASVAERAQIMQGLDSLPLHHVSGVDTMVMVPNIPSDKVGWVTLGQAHDFGVTNRIQLSRQELTTPQAFQDTLIHEVGHTVDYNHKPYPFGPGASSHHGYGTGGRVTEYAHTNPKEDYAESYQEYNQRPDNLKKVSPEKFQDQQANNHPSWTERLVDRKEFRETGKYLGDLMGPNQAARQSVETLRGAAGALGVVNGVQQWASSGWTGDGLQHASGILSTVAGALTFAGAPLVGVGVQAANMALAGAVKRGALTSPEVESTIALPVRPLEAVFGRKAVHIQEDHRPGKVLAVGAGGAVGGTVGAMAGPYLGVIGGYHLAGGLGGAVGLVAGGVLGFMGGTALGGRVGAALADLAA